MLDDRHKRPRPLPPHELDALFEKLVLSPIPERLPSEAVRDAYMEHWKGTGKVQVHPPQNRAEDWGVDFLQTTFLSTLSLLGRQSVEWCQMLENLQHPSFLDPLIVDAAQGSTCCCLVHLRDNNGHSVLVYDTDFEISEAGCVMMSISSPLKRLKLRPPAPIFSQEAFAAALDRAARLASQEPAGTQSSASYLLRCVFRRAYKFFGLNASDSFDSLRCSYSVASHKAGHSLELCIGTLIDGRPGPPLKALIFMTEPAGTPVIKVA